MQKISVFILLLGLPMVLCHVIELDDSFLERRKEGMWLVEFYAPWCGHCKKLEPTYQQVGRILKDTPVTVAKLDCTRFTSVASEFGVSGFPTIKFISGEVVHTHRGDRSAEDIIEFVKKAQGPVIRKLASTGKFNEAKNSHKDDVFFLFVNDDDDNENDLFKKYSSIAERLATQSYFYAGRDSILPHNIKPKEYPTVLVFKDKLWYEYEAPDSVASMSSLEDWIKGERYRAYPKVSGGNINEMAEAGKNLVMIVVDPNDTEKKAINDKVKQIGNALAVQHREKFHRDFQFLWMTETETVNSITISFLTAPVIIVLDTKTHYYYFLDFDIKDITENKLSSFLEDVKLGKVPVEGGTGFLQRLKRLFYDIFVTVLSIWQSSRWLFLLMFGLPTCVISIVCYSICCMEPVDDGTPDSDEEGYDDEPESQQYISEEKPAPPYHEKAD